MANLTISVNDSDKKEFSNFCDKIGISSSSLLNMFIKTVIREQKIPFSISLKREDQPNWRTRMALKEGDALVAAEDAPAYTTLKDLWESLEK